VFVTSGTRDATSTNIEDYNQFVNNAAQASTNLNTALTTAGLTPSAINWTAIGSTGTVNARLNTATRAIDPSVPIYRVDGAQVATGNVDLWDGSIQTPININEGGEANGGGGVATGTLRSGSTAGDGAEIGNWQNRKLLIGTSISTSPGWIEALVVQNDTAGGLTDSLFSFYGISSIVTVPTAPTTTPEPSSLLSFITLGGLILGGAVRGVRK
jgi:hypothetical protein